jgi:2-dehydropantoate 2-reductase
MEFLVIGAGAVGGYLGARLALAGHNVTMVVRGAAAEVIERNGLTVVDGEQRTTTKDIAVDTLRQALTTNGRFDQILLCVKAYNAQTALDELATFSSSPPNVITLQNGIGVEELFVEEFGREHVIAGSLTTPLSHATQNSVVVERSDRGLALAPTLPEQNIAPIVGLFQESGIDTVGFKEYQAMKWSKALLNMVGNATSAILNRHPKVVYGYGPTFKLEMAMLKETLAVMKTLKLKPVDLPGAQTGRLVLAVKRLPKRMVKPILTGVVAEGRGNKMPSFHIDLAAGKTQNEVSFHNGAVARIGASAGVPAPVNDALNDILVKLARREIDYQLFNGRPDRLVDAVENYRRGK